MLSSWLLAARPATLWAGVAPVLVAGALAARDEVFSWPHFLVTLVAATAIQVGVNFANDVADAAKGKGIRKGSFGSHWLILPAAGAGLYALATSGSFTRQAKNVMNQAKTRASELPDDLMSRVRQTSQKSASGSGGQGRGNGNARRQPRSTRKSTARASSGR